MASAYQIAEYVYDAGVRRLDRSQRVSDELATTGGAGAESRTTEYWRTFPKLTAAQRNKSIMLTPLATAAVTAVELARAAGAGADAAADAVVPQPVQDAASTAARQAAQAGAWMGRRENWVRVAQVVAGGAMVIVGLVMVARPAVQSAAQSAIGQVTKSVIKASAGGGAKRGRSRGGARAGRAATRGSGARGGAGAARRPGNSA